MEKLNLAKLRLAIDDVLQRNQMTTIYGGSDGCNYYYCQCTGSTGAWQGYYCSAQEIVDAIDRNCELENGSCT
ncbi:MAG: hypothetical protein R6V72_17345 [Cyclobacterium sp.]|uniref:hypothetical protein n=1 Tax=unclassified Cyclobacterium TaxID=2615055 RepID=UPI0013D5696D|nr:hypothetical protein [Cyclobacterium sp. SYSU L10401]